MKNIINVNSLDSSNPKVLDSDNFKEWFDTSSHVQQITIHLQMSQQSKKFSIEEMTEEILQKMTE